MKKIIAVMLITMSFISTAANATAWCRAESHTSWGEGTSYNVNDACRIALYQCAIRTNHHDTCFVVDSGH